MLRHILDLENTLRSLLGCRLCNSLSITEQVPFSEFIKQMDTNK